MPSMRRWEDDEKLKLMRLIRTHSTDWITIRSHMPQSARSTRCATLLVEALP